MPGTTILEIRNTPFKEQWSSDFYQWKTIVRVRSDVEKHVLYFIDYLNPSGNIICQADGEVSLKLGDVEINSRCGVYTFPIAHTIARTEVRFVDFYVRRPDPGDYWK